MMGISQTPFDVRCSAREQFKRWRPYLGYQAQRVRDFAQQFLDENGVEPTYQQVCDELGIPTRGEVSRIVAGLERRGEATKRTGPGPRLKLVNR